MAEDGRDTTAVARAVLEGIGARALATNQQRVAQLREAMLSATQGELTGVERARAIDTAHQLVGSAGTFGYRRVSRLARQVELGLAADAGECSSQEQALGWLAEMEQELLTGPAELD